MRAENGDAIAVSGRRQAESALRGQGQRDLFIVKFEHMFEANFDFTFVFILEDRPITLSTTKIGATETEQGENAFQSRGRELPESQRAAKEGLVGLQDLLVLHPCTDSLVGWL